MPTELSIPMLTTLPPATLVVALVMVSAVAVMAALSGLLQRRAHGRGRAPTRTVTPSTDERNPFAVVLLDALLARPRPIYLKVRSQRAPPTFPRQPRDVGDEPFDGTRR